MDIYEVRAARLRKAIDELAEGNAAAFARRYGISPSLLSRYLKRDTGHSKNMTEKFARPLEVKIRKPEGWFDIIEVDGQVAAVPGNHDLNEPASPPYGAKPSANELYELGVLVGSLSRVKRMQLAPLLASLAESPETIGEAVAAIYELLDLPRPEFTQTWEQTAREVAAREGIEALCPTPPDFIRVVDEAHRLHEKPRVVSHAHRAAGGRR